MLRVSWRHQCWEVYVAAGFPLPQRYVLALNRQLYGLRQSLALGITLKRALKGDGIVPSDAVDPSVFVRHSDGLLVQVFYVDDAASLPAKRA
jgi:hypothetical protein